jgi:hypothetical protein
MGSVELPNVLWAKTDAGDFEKTVLVVGDEVRVENSNGAAHLTAWRGESHLYFNPERRDRKVYLGRSLVESGAKELVQTWAAQFGLISYFEIAERNGDHTTFIFLMLRSGKDARFND